MRSSVAAKKKNKDERQEEKQSREIIDRRCLT